jgi:hypothetical protein
MSDWHNEWLDPEDKAKFFAYVAEYFDYKGAVGAMSFTTFAYGENKGRIRLGFMAPVEKAPAPMKAPGAIITAADAPDGISKTADTMGADGHYWRLGADGTVMRAKPGQNYKPVPGNITAPQAKSDTAKAKHAEAAATMSKGRRGKRAA